MWIKLTAAVLSSVCFVSCQLDSSYAIERSLSSVSGGDPKYRDTLVKVCGFATNEFENVQISDSRVGDWRETSAGLMVEWLDSEPRTNGPEQRCVTGLLEPMCGWDEYENTDLICRSTGSSYNWKIRQTHRARD